MIWRSAEFPATEIGAREGVVELVRDLASDGLSPDDLGTIEIVLAEVVNNIVEHANRDRDRGGVRISYCLMGNSLNMRIRDSGDGFEGAALPAGKLPDIQVAPEALPEGGFGWHLIRTLTSDVTYCRRDGWNDLGIRFDL
ncbi:MAG: ATP-binding protein [Arenibacterium sp.]